MGNIFLSNSFVLPALWRLPVFNLKFDQKQKNLLKQNIRETIRLTVTGDVVERQNFITIFSKNSDSAEKELQKQAMDLVNKFNNCGIKADILNEQELIQLCNSTLNINFAFREDNDDIDDKIPYLKMN